MPNSKLIFKDYKVIEINIHLNNEFVNVNSPVEINPIISRNIKNLDKDNALISLKVEIKNDGNKPFFGSVIIQGLFECKNYQNDSEGKLLIEENTSAILFPYLRHALSQSTLLLNIPPYTLPLVNTQNLFNK